MSEEDKFSNRIDGRTSDNREFRPINFAQAHCAEHKEQLIGFCVRRRRTQKPIVRPFPSSSSSSYGGCTGTHWHVGVVQAERAILFFLIKPKHRRPQQAGWFIWFVFVFDRL